jgi:hypothetical protein
MNRKRTFDQLSPSTQDKYVNVNYSRVWDDDADIVGRNSTGQTARVFLYIIPSMRMANGYLERAGEPIDTSEIAMRMGLTKREVGDALRQLYKLKVLGRTDTGSYYGLRMATYYAKRQGTAENGEKSEATNGNGEQQPKMAKNEPSAGRKVHEGNSENESSLVKLRSELESDQASLAETDSDSNSSDSIDADRKEGSSHSGTDCAVPSLLPFAGLTDTDLTAVRKKYPAVFAEYYSKFVQVNTRRNTQKVSIKDLWTWCKYLANITGTTAASPASTAASEASTVPLRRRVCKV